MEPGIFFSFIASDLHSKERYKRRESVTFRMKASTSGLIFSGEQDHNMVFEAGFGVLFGETEFALGRIEDSRGSRYMCSLSTSQQPTKILQ